MSLVLVTALLLVLSHCLLVSSYQYPKPTSQEDVCRDIVINALEDRRAEERKSKRKKHLQDLLWQDIWWFLCPICQMLEKFMTLLLALCRLVFMIWMLGLLVIVANALDIVATPRPRQKARPSSEKPIYQFIHSVLSTSARNHKPNNKPNFKRKPDIPTVPFYPVISPRSSINTYVNSVPSSAQYSQKIHTLKRIPDDRCQKLRSIALRRELDLQ